MVPIIWFQLFSRLAFGNPVKKSIHPGVNQFIEESLDGLLTALDARGESNNVEGIDLLIQDYDGDMVEKYAFRLAWPHFWSTDPTLLKKKINF